MINQNNKGKTSDASLNYEIYYEENLFLHNLEHSEHSIYVEMLIWWNLFF